MDVETGFNLFEGVMWIAIAATIFIRSRAQAKSMESLGAVTAATFFIFGISDFIEARTGAWWSPRWLLIMKALCVVGFVLEGVRYRQLRTYNENAKP